jgi:tripartite-type tricarboxylate transporter receptor subunit TctC
MGPIASICVRIIVAALFVLAAALPSRAAEDPARYPTQPIRMIVPFAAGGSSDFTARLLQQPLSKALGQQVVVENRPGAAGNVGMDAAARAAPDGYTMFLANVGPICVNPSMFPDLTVKPERDFIPVSLVSETPGLLIANPGFAPNTVAELIAYAKARPGQVNFASPGSGSVNRLEMEIFRREAGLDMTHIPYKGGAGPATADVVAGHVPVMFTTISSGINFVKDGRLKALGVTSRQRVASLPNVPTMVEQGFPKTQTSSWQGIMVPTGTPEPIVKKLYAAVVAAARDAEVVRRIEEAGAFPITSASQEEFRAYIAAESARWSAVVKETGATPE